MILRHKLRPPRVSIRAKYILTYALTIVLPILIFLWLLLGNISETILAQTVENTRQSNQQFQSNITAVIGAYLYQILPKIYLLEDSAMVDHHFFLRMEAGSEQAALYEMLGESGAAHWRYHNDKITISRPFTNYLMEPLGLVQVTVREQELYRQTEPYDVAERKIVIFDRWGTVVTSNDRPLVGEDIAHTEYFRRRLEGSPVYTADGQQVVLYEPMATEPHYPDWTIATIVPVGAVNTLPRRVLTWGCGLIGCCFLFSSAIYLSLSGGIVRRIRLLAARMQEVGRTQFVQIAHRGGGDEIGTVIDAFNEMSASLEQLIYDSYLSQLKLSKITIEKQNAELYALQNQMQPHFLFNTLESIRMKLQNGDTHRAQDMLVSLSKILRLSLSASEDLIPLGTELAYVRHYMQIQSARFPGRYRFRLEAPEALMGCPVPKYAVQTMTENAILHGIDPKGVPGRIDVGIRRREDGDVEIAVEDDGAGMTPERLEALKRRLHQTSEQIETTSIGLKNVSDRLHLHFGPRYGVTVASSQGRGTRVEIHVPYE